MDDLISRQQAIDAVKFYETFCDPYPRVIESLEKLPSIEPKKGKWICQADDDIWNCSECDFEIDGTACINPLEYLKTYKFCPNCGSYNGGDAK